MSSLVARQAPASTSPDSGVSTITLDAELAPLALIIIINQKLPELNLRLAVQLLENETGAARTFQRAIPTVRWIRSHPAFPELACRVGDAICQYRFEAFWPIRDRYLVNLASFVIEWMWSPRRPMALLQVLNVPLMVLQSYYVLVDSCKSTWTGAPVIIFLDD